MSIKKEIAPKGEILKQSHYNDILNLLQEGTQNYQVWKYMHECDFIDPRKAYQEFGILALHSRISDLRNLGAEIHKEMVYKKGKRYGVYSIKPDPIYCEVTDDVECPFRDGFCHRFEEGCPWEEWAEGHPEYLTDDEDETLRRIYTQEDIEEYADWLRSDK